VEQVLACEFNCPVRRIQALCRLLDDASTFREEPGAASRRIRFFIEPGMRDMEKSVLFADMRPFHRLESFEGFKSADSFLFRYDAAQLQAAVLAAEEITVQLHSDYKRAVRNINLSRLLHDISPLPGGGYRIVLSGPMSGLRSTSRYGGSLARFIPSLLACGRWNMRASLRGPWGVRSALELCDSDGYRSHLEEADEFDSAVEKRFAESFGGRRNSWRLAREDELLHRGQKIFIPDFVMRHDDGTCVFLEIAGFWTPEYLEEKRRTLEIFSEEKILLAIPEKSLEHSILPQRNVVLYGESLEPEPVIEALEAIRLTSSA
jgi:predicted nuclease of restriction endonuclease-like RecB superfamily